LHLFLYVYWESKFQNYYKLFWVNFLASTIN
jgi:hypothetical protein